VEVVVEVALFQQQATFLFGYCKFLMRKEIFVYPLKAISNARITIKKFSKVNEHLPHLFLTVPSCNLLRIAKKMARLPKTKKRLKKTRLRSLRSRESRLRRVSRNLAKTSLAPKTVVLENQQNKVSKKATINKN
jgi:hypothetical protein